MRMGISTLIGGSNTYSTKVQGTNLHKLPKLVHIGPKRGDTLRVMGVGTGFGLPVPEFAAHTGIGIWIFSPVTVSYLCGVNDIKMMAFVIPIKCFEVQDVRPVEGQYHVNTTSIWESVPGELNGSVLKFLSAKELVGLKSVCKNAKSAIKCEKGLLFDAIREQLDKIIEECGFESVPNAFKFKVNNCVRLGGALGPVGYVVNTTKRCMQIIPDEDVFKAGANIKFCRNMGNVHVCPYVGEVTGELRGNWVNARQVATGIQILMNL
jgi:hypothetical protein